MWSAARSAKISMILCMPERVSGGDAKFQGFCDRWNKWEGQVLGVAIGASEAETSQMSWCQRLRSTSSMRARVLLTRLATGLRPSRKRPLRVVVQ